MGAAHPTRGTTQHDHMKHDDATIQAAIDAAMHETRKNNSCKSFAACKKSWPKSWLKESPARLALAKDFLAKLPEPQQILADDGMSLGQVAHEVSKKYDEETYGSSGWKEWSDIKCQDVYEAAAQAVANVVLAQAIRRMEAVPWRELKYVNYEAVRARLIAAAMDEAEQHPDAQENWNQYAEKPAWTLPSPPAGHKWHRDDWTQDMLPEGYRPLLNGEIRELVDEWSYDGLQWSSVYEYGPAGDTVGPAFAWHRTRRLLPSWSQVIAELREMAKVAGVERWEAALAKLQPFIKP